MASEKEWKTEKQNKSELTKVVLITSGAGVRNGDCDGFPISIIVLSAAGIGDLDSTTAVGALIHPVGRKSSNVGAIWVHLTAGTSFAGLIVVGCNAIVTTSAYSKLSSCHQYWKGKVQAFELTRYAWLAVRQVLMMPWGGQLPCPETEA